MLSRFGGAPRVVVFVDGQAGSLPYGGHTLDKLDNSYYHFGLVEALGRLGAGGSGSLRTYGERGFVQEAGGCSKFRGVFH